MERFGVSFFLISIKIGHSFLNSVYYIFNRLHPDYYMCNFAKEFITETNNLKHYNLMKTTLLSLKAFFTICLLCLVGGVSASAQNTYTKVTSEDQLVAGGIYVIVNENYKVAMSWQDNNNRRAISIEINNNSFTLADADIANAETDKTVYELQLGGETGKWTFYDKINNGYLFAPGTVTKTKKGEKPNNYLKTQKTVDAKSQAKISFDAKGNSSIVFSAPNANTLRFNDNNHSKNPEKNQQLFSCYKSGQDPVQLYRKVGTFTLTTAQYGTYYTEDAFVMPEGVTGYTITSEDGQTLKFNEAYVAGAVVPAKTALVLKATEELTANKEYTYTIVNSTAVAPTDNLLHGSVAEAMTNVEGAKAYYKLANDKVDHLGFYYGAENGGEFKNGAHKAYLAVTTKALSQMRGFSFDSMTTGINHVVANAEHAKNTVIYDLNGRRVNSLNAATKGVYIVNGKKVIVK